MNKISIVLCLFLLSGCSIIHHSDWSIAKQEYPDGEIVAIPNTDIFIIIYDDKIYYNKVEPNKFSRNNTHLLTVIKPKTSN